MRSIRTLIGAAVLGLASTATAAPMTFDIDRAHSEVGFSIRHFFSKVSGSFKEFSGVIVYDPQNIPGSSVDVAIQTTSISTGNDRRDAHLRTPDFFAADSFPTITFKSTRVVPTGKNKAEIHGDLTMRGVTRPVVLDAEFLGMGPVGIGGQSLGTKAGFDAATRLNRQHFGIRWNKTLDQGGLMLDDEVAVVLHVEADLRTPEKK